MLFLMFLLSITVVCASNTGSSIFYKRFREDDCWNKNDIARLRARQIFEQIIPPQILPDKINDTYVTNILRYFRSAIKRAVINSNENTDISAKDLLADTIASHMRSEILPTSRFAYYAGYISYKRARQLHDFYNNLKIMLNTQGLGWKPPDRVPNWSNFTMEKISIGNGKYGDPCMGLITKRDSRSCIHLPPPKVDDNLRPSALALPFKREGFISLESPKSENILLKYYTTASRCILRKSPTVCRHYDFVNFNNEMWHWMKRDVAPHLVDEKLYAAYGGVLRIAATVQSYGKGLSQRNLFTYQGADVSKWHPWKTLRESYVFVNDSSPYLYVFIVLSIAIAVCFLQICYGYILGNNGCHCQGHKRQPRSVDLEYANVDSNIPAMIPSPRSVQRESTSITKSPLGSVTTQKVYDMHENKEEMINVFVNDSEDSPKSSSESQMSDKKHYTIDRQSHNQNDSREKTSRRSYSPPKLETTISEIRLEKKLNLSVPQISTYSTSTVTDSGRTFRRESSMSSTGSSTSEVTPRSTSSKTSRRRSRLSRNLAWARRVASKHARSTSGTEFDYKSFTTPPSKGT